VVFVVVATAARDRNDGDDSDQCDDGSHE
jgi:hypothetical protein